MQISKYNRLIIFLFKLFSCMLLNLKGQRPNNCWLYFWTRHNEKKETQTISDSPQVEASSKDICSYTKTTWVMTHMLYFSLVWFLLLHFLQWARGCSQSWCYRWATGGHAHWFGNLALPLLLLLVIAVLLMVFKHLCRWNIGPFHCVFVVI